MARYIDADKALETLDEWLEATGALPKGTSYYHECKSCINETPTENVMPVKWISVDDGIPKNNLARVLVFLKDDEFTKAIGFNKIDTDRCIDGRWVRWGEHVTHWMPLPESPKNEGADNG